MLQFYPGYDYVDRHSLDGFNWGAGEKHVLVLHQAGLRPVTGRGDGALSNVPPVISAEAGRHDAGGD
jgi:beta-mannanase